jgi:hypothetical protein
LALAFTTGARAGSMSLDASGALHKIEIDPNGKGHRLVDPTLLRHIVEEPDGFVHAYVVTGTDDSSEEREPDIRIDPVSGVPLMAWLRLDATSTAVLVSRFDGAAWSSPVVVATGVDVKDSLQLHVGNRLAHVAWSQGPTDPPAAWLASVDRTTLATVFGPAALTTDEPSPVPPEGAPAGEASLPPSGDSFFTLGAPPRFPEEAPRIIVYGARDEPVPVNFLQGFLLPEDVVHIDTSGAEIIANRMVVWYVSGGRFYYAFRDPTDWSSTRAMRLYPLEVTEARALVREMLSRLPAVPPAHGQ